MEKFLALSLSDVVFIMLINVKMPTIVGIFNIYEPDKFRAQLSWHVKSFITSGPGFNLTRLHAYKTRFL